MGALQRANLLNCYARASAFALAEGLTLAQLLESTSARLLDARSDRLFLRIGNDAAARPPAFFGSGPFEPAPAALHAPPPGYQLAQSGKTHDPLLSFQVTLFKGDGDYTMEMEFDNIQALLCVFRALEDRRDLRNLGRTHPYDVHQLLIRYQHVDPGYELRT